MRNSKAIKQTISEGMAKVTAILAMAKEDDRECTDEEQTEIDGWAGVSDDEPGKLAALNADLIKAERLETIIKANQALSAPQAFQQRAHDDGVPSPFAAKPRRIGNIRNFENKEDAYASGQFVMATMLGNKKANAWCLDNGIITADMSEGVDTAGGFLVPEQFESTIIRLVESFGILQQFARIWPMSAEVDHIPRREGGLTVTYPGEGLAITKSDLTLGQITLTAVKRATLTAISSELNEDSAISLAELMSQEIALAFAQKQDDDGFNGDGSGAFGGVSGLDDALLAGSTVDAAATHVGFETLEFVDFEETIGRLPDFADNERTAWFIHKTGYAKSMMRLMNAAGGNTKLTIADANGRERPMFLDYPVVFTNVMPSVSAVSTNLMYLGDLNSSIALGTRRGVTIKSSDQHFFNTDQLAVRATERIAIDVHETGTASEAGSVVALKSAAS